MLIQFLVIQFLIFVEMKFVKDKESQAFERVVASILDVTGNLGGWFEIMEVAGGMAVGLFSGRLFLFSILSHLYHITDPLETSIFCLIPRKIIKNR